VRHLILGALIAGGVALAAAPSRAADVFCAPYAAAWKKAHASGQLSRMNSVIKLIPDACADEIAQAKQERGDFLRQQTETREAQHRAAERAAAAERERQAQAEQDRQAEEQRKRNEAAAAAAAAQAKTYQVSICNSAGLQLYVALVYLPIADNKWKYTGWYKLNDKDCYDFSTSNATFYYYGNNYDDKNSILWAGDDDKDKENRFCINEKLKYEFNSSDEVASKCSGENLKSVLFGKRTADQSPFKVTLTYTPKQ
jgi:uncharacterized membrane protein